MDNFMDKIAQKLNSQELIRANAAADALLAETAVRGLIFDAILPGIDANLFRGLVETGGVGFHLFNSRRQEFFTHL